VILFDRLQIRPESELRGVLVGERRYGCIAAKRCVTMALSCVPWLMVVYYSIRKMELN